MKKWLRQNKSSAIIFGFLIIVIFPFIIYLLSSIPILPVGGNNDWAGFWGGYIGSILGGIIALYVMFESLDRERNNQIMMIKNEECKNININAYIVYNDLKNILENLHELVMEYAYFEYFTGIPGVFECSDIEKQRHYKYFANWKVNIDPNWRQNVAALGKVEELREIDLYGWFSELSYYCKMLEIEEIQGIRKLDLHRIFQGDLLTATEDLFVNYWRREEEDIEYTENILNSLKGQDERTNKLKFINDEFKVLLDILKELTFKKVYY